MDKLIIDLTSYSSTKGTFMDFFEIDSDYLINEFFWGREKKKGTVEEFKKYAGITGDLFGTREVFLSSLHVTTNSDSCESIRKHGLLDLQQSLIKDTHLSRFFKDNGIEIRPDHAELIHNGETYKLNPHTRGGILSEHVSFKLYQDHPVWGFVSNNDVLNYGGNVKRRPEFIENVAKFINNLELVDQWEKLTTTYILKYSLPFDRYQLLTPSYCDDLGDLIVQTMYDYIQGGGTRDVISLLREGDQVHPHEIIEYFTVKEYMQYKIQ